jgi:hypothetical protein
MNQCSQTCWNCDLFSRIHTASPDKAPPPMEDHPYLARIKVCEQKFNVTGYFYTPPPSLHCHPRYTATLDISPQISVNKKGWHSVSPADSVRETAGVPVVVLLLRFCSYVVCSNAPSYWPCFETNENVFCEVAIWVLYFFVLNSCIAPEHVSKKKRLV